jgi:hypothetical protein
VLENRDEYQVQGLGRILTQKYLKLVEHNNFGQTAFGGCAPGK